MQLNLLLLKIAGVVFVIYFILFQMHINTLSNQERMVFTNKSKPGKLVNILVALPVASLIFVENYYLRIVAIILVTLYAIVGSIIQNKSLNEQGLSTGFTKKLTKINTLALISLAFMCASLIITPENA